MRNFALVLLLLLGACDSPTRPKIIECRYEITIGQSIPRIIVSSSDSSCKLTDSKREYLEFLKFHGGP